MNDSNVLTRKLVLNIRTITTPSGKGMKPILLATRSEWSENAWKFDLKGFYFSADIIE